MEDESEDKVYEVENIIDKRSRRGQIQYLLKWLGYSEKHNSWEPLENLFDSAELVQEFENKIKLKSLRPGYNGLVANNRKKAKKLGSTSEKITLATKKEGENENNLISTPISSEVESPLIDPPSEITVGDHRRPNDAKQNSVDPKKETPTNGIKRSAPSRLSNSNQKKVCFRSVETVRTFTPNNRPSSPICISDSESNGILNNRPSSPICISDSETNGTLNNRPSSPICISDSETNGTLNNRPSSPICISDSETNGTLNNLSSSPICISDSETNGTLNNLSSLPIYISDSETNGTEENYQQQQPAISESQKKTDDKIEINAELEMNRLMPTTTKSCSKDFNHSTESTIDHQVETEIPRKLVPKGVFENSDAELFDSETISAVTKIKQEQYCINVPPDTHTFYSDLDTIIPVDDSDDESHLVIQENEIENDYQINNYEIISSGENNSSNDRYTNLPTQSPLPSSLIIHQSPSIDSEFQSSYNRVQRTISIPKDIDDDSKTSFNAHIHSGQMYNSEIIAGDELNYVSVIQFNPKDDKYDIHEASSSRGIFDSINQPSIDKDSYYDTVSEINPAFFDTHSLSTIKSGLFDENNLGSNIKDNFYDSIPSTSKSSNFDITCVPSTSQHFYNPETDVNNVLSSEETVPGNSTEILENHDQEAQNRALSDSEVISAASILCSLKKSMTTFMVASEN